ncbi:MAG: hypothetical protein MZV65_43850 [Chromatiales bacterium]|nr:hypothetical protein [Chromatiales bacterium]
MDRLADRPPRNWTGCPADASARAAAPAAICSLQLERIAGEDWHEIGPDRAGGRRRCRSGDLNLAVGLAAQAGSAARRKLDAELVRARRAACRSATATTGHAAQLYLDARRRAASRSERREYFFAAVAALQSGNMPGEAVAARRCQPGRTEPGPGRPVPDGGAGARGATGSIWRTKYVRLLLRLSLLQPVAAPRSRSACGDFRVVRAAAPAAAAPNAQRGGPQLPFDDTIYSLGYDVFLANRKLEDAYQVAAAAVRQAPENAAWRLAPGARRRMDPASRRSR